MKTENKTKLKKPDYKAIRELSYCMDCTITQADFNTSSPNPLRIDYLISDMNRYLKYAGGKFNGIKY